MFKPAHAGGNSPRMPEDMKPKMAQKTRYSEIARQSPGYLHSKDEVSGPNSRIMVPAVRK